MSRSAQDGIPHRDHQNRNVPLPSLAFSTGSMFLMLLAVPFQCKMSGAHRNISLRTSQQAHRFALHCRPGQRVDLLALQCARELTACHRPGGDTKRNNGQAEGRSGQVPILVNASPTTLRDSYTAAASSSSTSGHPAASGSTSRHAVI